MKQVGEGERKRERERERERGREGASEGEGGRGFSAALPKIQCLCTLPHIPHSTHYASRMHNNYHRNVMRDMQIIRLPLFLRRRQVLMWHAAIDGISFKTKPIPYPSVCSFHPWLPPSLPPSILPPGSHTHSFLPHSPPLRTQCKQEMVKIPFATDGVRHARKSILWAALGVVPSQHTRLTVLHSMIIMFELCSKVYIHIDMF